MNKKMIDLHTIYGGFVTERLETARVIAGLVAADLRESGDLYESLQDVRETAVAVNEQMALMEMGNLCTHCSQEPGGGCCSLYMSGETDAIQLALNICIGVEVQIAHRDDGECLFLGGQGCIFLFKPMFCLNYLCHRIHQLSPASQVEKLESLTGQHLSCYFQLEQEILRRVLGSPWP